MTTPLLTVLAVITVCLPPGGNTQTTVTETTVPPSQSPAESGSGSVNTTCLPVPTGLCTLSSDTGFYIPNERDENTAFLNLAEFQSQGLSTECTSILVGWVCGYVYIPCHPDTGKQMIICESSCPVIDRIFMQCFPDFTAQAGNVSVNSKNTLLADAFTFNCSDPSTYLIEGYPIDERCNDISALGNIVPPPTTAPLVTTGAPPIVTTDGGTNIGDGVIAGAVVAVLVFIALIVLITMAFAIGCCVFRKRMKEPWAEMEFKNESKANVVVSTAVRYSLPNGDIEDSDTVVMTESDKKQYKTLFSSVLVPYAKIEIGDCVGEGAFGKVHRGEVQTSSDQTSEIAIKTIKNLSSQNELEAFFSESLIMKDFNHPNVLGLAGVCFDTPDDVPYIILPFMVNGSLKDYLKKQRVHESNVDTYPENLQLAVLVGMCIDIAHGMDYLAEKKFVHRDLAARNCMVSETLAIKVGDFGLARDVYSSDYYRASTKAKVPVKWMPPETLHDGISNEKTDVWSFGVTCWEVFSLGRTPYPGVQNHDMIKFISSGGRLERPTLCPEKLYRLFVMCWEAKSEDRPTFSKLVELLEDYYDKELSYV